MWNCPYSSDYFKDYAEPEDGQTYSFMASIAKTANIYLVGDLFLRGIKEESLTHVFSLTLKENLLESIAKPTFLILMFQVR
jgi:hypothetical protein